MDETFVCSEVSERNDVEAVQFEFTVEDLAGKPEPIVSGFAPTVIEEFEPGGIIVRRSGKKEIWRKQND